jgi:hypothetical protein
MAKIQDNPPVLTTLTKSLKDSVVTRHVNFDPTKYRPRTIIVNGRVAILLKGNIYTKA